MQNILSLRQFFYDEMSMVGRELFDKSECRLREIFGTGNTFGGLHVIVVGDFFQMAPVRDSYVFKDDFKDYGSLSPNLWKDHFYIYALTEIMHQKDEKQFCEVLNRLRIGELMESDNELFMSRIVKKSDAHYVPDARHFFPLKESARKHNETVYLSSTLEKGEIQACHVISGNHSVEARKKFC